MSAPREFQKHYTLAEARSLLPALPLWLAELRLLQRQLTRSGERTAELLAEGRDLGGERVNEPLRNLARVQELLAELSSRELQLKDLDRGLVDFPSLRGDREVFLCWEDGEDDIEYWHDLETGYAGRERLT
jgi:hypothetical protein